MSDRRQRRLLPAAPKEQSTERGPGDPEQPRRSRGKGITRISTACEACKKRKTKCSGLPAPCTICSTQGTECIIDESLDQRRRTSTNRLTEGSRDSHHLLAALLQSLRFSELDDFQELAISIRNNIPTTDVAAILERNVRKLEDRGTLWPVDQELEELGAAFRTSSLASQEAESNNRTAGSSIASESSTSRISDVHEWQASEKTTARPGKQKRSSQTFADQVKIYKRWISLFGSKPDPEADSRLERYPTIYGGPAEIGLWRRTSKSSHAVSPVEAEEPEDASQRSRWHPALHIQNAPTGGGSEPAMDLSNEEQSQLANLTSGLEVQEAEGWVETLRSVPDLTEMAQTELSGADVPQYEGNYHLDFARYPLFSVQPIISYEDSPLSRVITDYLFAARSTLEQGVAPIEILGFDGIDVALFFRDREPEDTYTVSDWAAELWRSFHDWDIFVRLACCLSSTYIMRWLVVPTARRYADVPDILKPLPIQRIKPHHVAIDLLPIPSLREALVKNFRDFMTALPEAGLSVNWTGTMEEAVTTDAELGYLRLTETFEKHVIKMENWSIGESALSIFPELQGSIRIDQR